MKRNLLFAILCLSRLSATLSQAQTKLQVVEKTVTRKVELSAGEGLSIIGEKADIRVSGWDKNYVEIRLVFSAKHLEKLVAQEELDYMKYSITREENKVELRNTFLIPGKTAKLKSSLNLIYELKTPRDCKLSIENRYGNVAISDKKGEVKVKAEFGNIKLYNVSGSLLIKSSFSEIRGNSIKGITSIASEKSSISLSGLQGSYTIDASYGNIAMDFHTIQSLKIKANRTSVVIFPQDPTIYNFDLYTTHSEIFGIEKYKYSLNQTGNSTSLLFAPNKNNPLIKIQTTYSPITIKN